MDTTRLYYSIREVREELHLTDATLRFWEEKFARYPQMQVYHDPQGNRHYSAENIRFLRLLKYLRDELKITRIEAMQRWLDNTNENRLDIRVQASDILRQIREDLVEIRAMI